MKSNDSTIRAAFLAHSPALVACSVVLMLQSLVVVALPFPVPYLIDVVFPHQGSDAFVLMKWLPAATRGQWLAAITVVLLVLAGLKYLLDFLEEWAVNSSSARIIENVRKQLVGRLLKLRLGFFESRPSVDLLGRISGDTAVLEFMVSAALSLIVRAVPTLILILGMMIWVQPFFAMAVMLLAPIMVWISISLSLRLKNLARNTRRAQNAFDMDLHQTLSTIPLVKSLTMEEDVAKSLNERAHQVTQSLVQARKAQGHMTASLNGVRNLLWISVIAIGGFGVFAGRVTLGELVLFLAYTDALGKPISEIAKYMTKYQRVVASQERLHELEQQIEGLEERSGELSLETPQHGPVNLQFKNVNFNYQNGRTIISQLNAEFKAGELVAVIGASGSGKSTLLKLLNRLIDPSVGRILLNGLPLDWLRLDELRRFVVAVPQDSLFLPTTIRQNLNLGLKNGDARLAEALNQVHALEFINSMPEELDTELNEHGLPLSGGQKKRLHVARALLRERAGILALDEPTSGLDPLSSARVAQSLKTLTEQGKLIFWVTHDLEHIHLADRILYLKPGWAPIVGTSASLEREIREFRNQIEGELS